jgi:hypothetical protein
MLDPKPFPRRAEAICRANRTSSSTTKTRMNFTKSKHLVSASYELTSVIEATPQK